MHAVFTSDPTLLTVVAGPPGYTSLSEWGIDGLPRGRLPSGTGSDPVWSWSGELAVVRGSWIWVGSPGKLRRFTRGSAPSWSPYGNQIVVDRRGWVMIGRLRGGSVRRLVRGTAPAWSPDGRWIAFFDGRHRLNVIPARGGNVRRVGKVTGRTVDWQPLPVKAPAPCQTPPGSTVIASSETALVSLDSLPPEFPGAPGTGSWAALGCLRSSGRERVLTAHMGFYPPGPAVVIPNVTEAATAGPYAALAITTNAAHYVHTASAAVSLFDLRTGLPVPNRGGEQAGCSNGFTSPQCESSMDQLVLGSDAVSAVHSTVRDDQACGSDFVCNPPTSGCTCTVEQIQASDSTGVHTLDSVTEPDGSPPALTNLTLTGDTLTWNNSGTPRSAQLQP